MVGVWFCSNVSSLNRRRRLLFPTPLSPTSKSFTRWSNELESVRSLMVCEFSDEPPAFWGVTARLPTTSPRRATRSSAPVVLPTRCGRLRVVVHLESAKGKCDDDDDADFYNPSFSGKRHYRSWRRA
jgi:hypothetical protein|tara:strand:- start:2314 stop:2694 length:381 start_codon:yes stop_codon:yes gene_type:complete